MRTYDECGTWVRDSGVTDPKIEDYMQKLLLHGRKEITVDRYRCVLKMFCRILTGLGRTCDPEMIEEDDVYAALQAANVSLPTQESYALIIRQWCRYYKNYKPNGVKVLNNHETPTARWISYEELVLSMKAAKTKSEAFILYLGGNYGLRRGEIASLGVDDIKKGYMIIHGKGHGPEGKIRKVPLSGDTDEVIDLFIEYRQNLIDFCDVDDSDGRLLVFKKRNRVKAFTPEHVGNACKKTMNRAGVDGTTHSLRREFITTAYRADAQLLDIMRIVGHTDPRQTARYIESDMEYMRSTINLRKVYISKESSLV